MPSQSGTWFSFSAGHVINSVDYPSARIASPTTTGGNRFDLGGPPCYQQQRCPMPSQGLCALGIGSSQLHRTTSDRAVSAPGPLTYGDNSYPQGRYLLFSEGGKASRPQQSSMSHASSARETFQTHPAGIDSSYDVVQIQLLLLQPWEGRRKTSLVT